MHNTPPPLPLQQRTTINLIEDLCLALQDVGVRDGELPEGPRVLKAIADVRAINCELDTRAVDVSERLATLSEQTHWRMAELLRDCLAFPGVVPYVKEPDGIRRWLRCRHCHAKERPPNARVWVRDDCLKRIIQAVRTRTPINGIILFRTYNPEARCAHADANTVLASQSWIDSIAGNCEKCFQEEQDRRMHATQTPA